MEIITATWAMVWLESQTVSKILFHGDSVNILRKAECSWTVEQWLESMKRSTLAKFSYEFLCQDMITMEIDV